MGEWTNHPLAHARSYGRVPGYLSIWPALPLRQQTQSSPTTRGATYVWPVSATSFSS